jgi:hypothetical protein
VDGEPVLLISGLGASESISLADGSYAVLDPEAGTCPVFLEDRILCVPRDPGSGPLLQAEPLSDVMTRDFDTDGRLDAAWITRSSMTVWLSSRQGTETGRRPGSTLAAWGVLDQVAGLACCWEGPGGTRTWSRLSWSGFQDSPSSGPMRLEWSGRIESGCNMTIGVLADSLVMASAGGDEVIGLGPCRSLAWDQFDEGSIDAACLDDAGWRLVLDPGDGGGLDMPFSATTSSADEAVLTGSFSIRLYTGENGFRRAFAGGPEG